MSLHFMAHNFKPILLIDDKKEGQNRGESFKQTLPNELQKLVDFHLDINQLFRESDEWSIEVLFNPNKYVNVFLHHSYNDGILNDSQLSDLKDKLKDLDVFIFSGGMGVNAITKEVSRDILFRNLKLAIDAYSKMGIFPTAYLFGGQINRYYPILNEMQKILEEYGKDILLKHKSFEAYMSICDYDVHSVRKNYKEKFTEEQIADKINEWRLNANQ